ncbi:MAG: biopolymer transporter ExbD [SAR324 cluster bacterium]|nr:biopolymer transporter ExbD [SAR324 cluster bacterium]
MQLFEKQKTRPSINLTPLIDILFLLIIFFVVSSKIIGDSGIGIVLPQSSQGESAPVTLPMLLIDANQTIWLNGTSVKMEELIPKLGDLRKAVITETLILNVDKRVPHGIVIQLMDDAKKSGFRKIVFGTESRSEN